MRQMAHDQSRRRPTMLVTHDDVTKRARLRAPDQLLQYQIPTIRRHSRRQHQPHLLLERAQPATGVARRHNEHARVADAGERGVFIVEVELVFRGAVRDALVVFEVAAEGGVVGDGGIEGLAGCEGRFQGGALLRNFGVAERERAAVEVVPALASLLALAYMLSLAPGGTGIDRTIISG